MKKYYNYSVKERLLCFFGEENTIAALRDIKRDVNRNVKDWVPLAWQYADQQALGHFVAYSKDFLSETILTDDYIVYIGERETGNKVFIMFMLTQQQAPFCIDTEYARQITEYWGKKYNCEAVILSVCVGISSRLCFSSSSSPAYRDRTYSVIMVNGKPLLTEEMLSCMPFYYKKILSVARSNDMQEYECLFEPGAKITKGSEHAEEELGSGIAAIKDFLEEHSPVRRIYIKDENSGYYMQEVLVGDFIVNLYINFRNLIEELNIKAEVTDKDEFISVAETEDYGSMVAKVTEIQSVRALDTAQIHGYGIQLCYADGTVRNYYLKTFETRDIPEQCVIEGYPFTEESLQTVRTDANKGVRFDNGYVIKTHILYYRSYRQVEIMQKNTVLYENEKCRIRLLYQRPLVQFHGWGIFRIHWGKPDEYFGPAFAPLDLRGKLTSDIAYYYSNSGDGMVQKAVVCVEPSARYGILNNDGGWAAPPVYADVVDELTEGCIKATRPSDGKTCLLTQSGKEVVFDYPVEAEWFENGRCPVNTYDWQGEAPDKGGYWEAEDMDPGNWGFIDTEGRFVIKPQYVYVTGFHEGKEKNCIVAKMVDGKLRWGVINRDGVEVVPCRYPFIYSPQGDAIIYQEKEDGLYGLMDFDGTVITEPRFGYIEEYNRDKKLIVAGKDEESLGVYSVELNSFIIPEKYDFVLFYTNTIDCEFSGDDEEEKNDFYDYSGKEITDYEEPDREFGVTDDFAERGLRLTGDGKRRGLADEKGRVILKTEYSSIRIIGEFIEATQSNDTNWSVRDYLFDMEGTPVLKRANPSY